MKIKYRVLENCTPGFSFSLCSIAGMSRPVTAHTQTVSLKLHVRCVLEDVTMIYTDQPQPAKTAMTCQGMNTGALGLMSGTVMLEVCPLNPLDCWVGVDGVRFSSTSDKCSIALGSGQTAAEATLWAFCHMLSQSIRMFRWLMCMWHAQQCHYEHCMLTIIHITCSLSNAVALCTCQKQRFPVCLGPQWVLHPKPPWGCCGH